MEETTVLFLVGAGSRFSDIDPEDLVPNAGIVCAEGWDDAIVALGKAAYSVVLVDASSRYPISLGDIAAHMEDTFGVPVVFVLDSADPEIVRSVDALPNLGIILRNTPPFVVVQTVRVARELFEAAHHRAGSVPGAPLGPDAVVVVDSTGIIRFWSEEAKSVLGWSAIEVIGQSIAQLFGEPVWPRFSTHTSLRYSAGYSFSGVFGLSHRSGHTIRIRVTECPIEDGEGSVVGYVWVVTEEAPAESSRRLWERRERHVDQARRLQYAGRLAAGVAHDVNNILSIILGYSSMVGFSLPAESPASEELSKLRLAVGRASQLTRRLLRFVKEEADFSDTFDLNDCVRDFASLLRPVAGDGVGITLDLADEPAMVVGEPTKIDQILLNLVTNATNAMPSGGAIRIATRRLPSEASSTAPEARSGDTSPSYVELSVSDTGVGMTPSTLSRIFEPFYTTRADEGGTGLGLAVVSSIVAEFDGSIGVVSGEGAGTTFRIRLPCGPKSNEIQTSG